MTRFFAILPLLLFIWSSAYAQETLYLYDGDDEHFVKLDFGTYLEDADKSLTIEDVSSQEFATKFKTIKNIYPENYNTSSAYWIKFVIDDRSHHQQNWLLESFHFKINRIDLFFKNAKGQYEQRTAGDLLSFSEREIQHKNFEFLLPKISSGPQVYYLRFEHAHATRLILCIRTYNRFASYALSEYFFLGIFYGIILIIAFYNLFLFFTIKDKAYLFYVLYIISVGLLSLCQDGLGFQYLWPKSPGINNSMPSIALLMMVVGLLLYTKYFLTASIRLPLINEIINTFIIFRIATFILAITIFPELKDVLFIDLIPFGIAYTTAILAYFKGYKPARFFILGFSVLFIAFLINGLRLMRILPPMILTSYAINIGALIEIILFSLALGERIKSIRRSEAFNKKLNQELEIKVKERTDAIAIQNSIIQSKINELDSFLYKASHDIKGPLKSIIGLAAVGLKDKPENSAEYFQHIHKSAKKLDNIVLDLLMITKINRSRVQYKEIDFKAITEDVLENLSILTDFGNVSYTIRVDQKTPFFSEKTILTSIFQNIIENAIKYRDIQAKRSYLDILIDSNEEEAVIEFRDNGIGIAKENQEKVFEMFYKISEFSSHSTGLGLYIVKISVEKLEGTIQMESEEGQGTTFIIRIPNRKAPLTVDQF
ncbi:MAG: sensor histidine kinase [Cytophagaceae bacterium]